MLIEVITSSLVKAGAEFDIDSVVTIARFVLILMVEISEFAGTVVESRSLRCKFERIWRCSELLDKKVLL